MTRWVFSGALLPAGQAGELQAGSGDERQLPGQYALPGLVDGHCHLSVRADEHGPLLGDTALAQRRLGELVRAGVTTIRDVGGDPTVTLPLTVRVVEGRPRVLAAGRFLAPSERYFPRMHVPVDPEELVAAAVEQIGAGARWVKLIGDFPRVSAGSILKNSVAQTYSNDVVGQVVAAAHGRGARVAVHTDSEIVRELIDVGIDSVEHGGGLRAEDLERLGSRGGAWTPTLCAGVGPADGRGARARDRSQRTAELLPLAAAAGVCVLAGSDVVGTVAEEVALLVEHGLSIEAALRAASTDARDYLGTQNDADIVTYDRDPREDPSVLAEPRAVVVRGVRVI